MPDMLAWAYVHTITVEAYQGSGPYGDSYGPPVMVRCFLDAGRRRVRDSNGDAVLSESTAICPLSTVAPPGSRVTLPDGHTSTVIVAKRHDGGGLPTPDHAELNLT